MFCSFAIISSSDLSTLSPSATSFIHLSCLLIHIRIYHNKVLLTSFYQFHKSIIFLLIVYNFMLYFAQIFLSKYITCSPPDSTNLTDIAEHSTGCEVSAHVQRTLTHTHNNQCQQQLQSSHTIMCALLIICLQLF